MKRLFVLLLLCVCLSSCQTATDSSDSSTSDTAKYTFTYYYANSDYDPDGLSYTDNYTNQQVTSKRERSEGTTGIIGKWRDITYPSDYIQFYPNGIYTGYSREYQTGSYSSYYGCYVLKKTGNNLTICMTEYTASNGSGKDKWRKLSSGQDSYDIYYVGNGYFCW